MVNPEMFDDKYNPQEGCTPITEGLDMFDVCRLLIERIPYLNRHHSTRRVTEESGVDALLDRHNELKAKEDLEIELQHG